MVWPPTTHQDVQDEVGISRLHRRDYFRPGYYSTGTWPGISPTGLPLSTGSLYVRPFYIGAQRRFDRIGCNVSTAATAASGGLIELALYEPGPGVPGPMVLTTATASTETTGAKEFIIDTTLDPGVWWVAAHSLVAQSSITGLGSVEHGTPFLSGTTTPLTTSYGGFLITTGVSTTTAGALPNPPTGSSPTTSTPLVSLRAA